MNSDTLGERIVNWQLPPIPDTLVLDGEYVSLSPLSATAHTSDLFRAFSLDSAHKNWRYLPYGPFDTERQLGDWITHITATTDPYFFAIKCKQSNRVGGVASYLRINPNDGSIEVGHIHLSPLLQHTTAATEAMFLMMRWAFENGYRRYEWKCNARNANSRRAAQRLGLSYEGIFRQATISKGRNRDTAWFAAIDKEWPVLKQCFQTYLHPSNFTDEGRQLTSLSALTRECLYITDPLFD